MYNRYIPNGNHYTRVVEPDALPQPHAPPPPAPHLPHGQQQPHMPSQEPPDSIPSHIGQQPRQAEEGPQPEGNGTWERVSHGNPGHPGGGPGRANWSGAQNGGQSAWQLPGGLGSLGNLKQLFSGEKGGLGGLFSGEKSGVNGILKALHLEELDSGDVLLVLIILFLLLEGDNLDLVITLGLMLLLGLADEKKEREKEEQDG